MASSPGGSDASHESENEGQSSTKIPASKDKECPYCHQKFTSSSLGRHLDQFLHKKKPDGVHDVDEIKKSRAGITRRTARGKKGDLDHNDSHVTTAHQSPAHAQPSPAFLESLNKSAPGTNDVKFNRMGWQATGVITDTPSANTHAPSPTLATGGNLAAGSKRSFSTYAADLPASANDTARALELSLREVLDAVSVAVKRVEVPPEPFPFELTSMSFPALTLALLPTPPTLYATVPFAIPTSISFKPPGFEQLEVLRQKIKTVLDQWKWDALAHVQRTSQQNGLNVGDEAARLTRIAQEKIDESLRHLDNSFHFFSSCPLDQQYQLWSIEMLRALKNEQDRVKQANERIAKVTQEAGQLQQQIDYLSRCQWPREMALWPPERNTFSSAVQKELQDGKITSLDSVNAYGTTRLPSSLNELPEDRWDFDQLVNKWKRHVREDRARRGGPGPGPGLMLPPVTETASPPPASLRKSISDGNQNGRSANNSPIIRNGGWSMGVTDKGVPSAKPMVGTPSSYSATPRTHTPVNRGTNVSIISDVDESMARFAPWFQQEREKE